MTPDELKDDPHMAPPVPCKGRKQVKFEKGYLEFQEIYNATESLQMFSLPLDFTGFNTPKYLELDDGLLRLPCVMLQH